MDVIVSGSLIGAVMFVLLLLWDWLVSQSNGSPFKGGA